MPSKYKLDNSYEVYTRENYDDAEYSLLHDYVFNCNKDYENNKWRTTLNSVVPFMLMLINKFKFRYFLKKFRNVIHKIMKFAWK